MLFVIQIPKRYRLYDPILHNFEQKFYTGSITGVINAFLFFFVHSFAKIVLLLS